MITGIHTMFYSSDAEGLRAFFRDKLGLKVSDTREGWFDLAEADLGCPPADQTGEEGELSGAQNISFYCDNIHTTVDTLRTRGVIFKGEVEDRGYGFVTYFKVPGDFYIQLFQPKYKK